MGKIVKYCTVCEEGFAEKFSFCPNCAATLMAYEMNPVLAEQIKMTEPLKAEEPVNNTVQHFEAEPPSTTLTNVTNVPEPVEEASAPPAPVFLKEDDSEILDLHTGPLTDHEEAAEEPEAVTFEPVVPAATVGSFNQPYGNSDYQSNYQYAVNSTAPVNDTFRGHIPATKADDDGYHITMVEEKK